MGKRRIIKSDAPVIKNHSMLNFKGVERLSFKKIKADMPNFSFKWGSLIDFFGGNTISAKEASLRASYETESLEFFYQKKYNKIPLTYTVDSDRFDKNVISDFFFYFEPPMSAIRLLEEYDEDDLTLNSFTIMLEEGLIMHYESDLTFYLDPEKHLNREKNNPFYVMLCIINVTKKKSKQRNKIHIVYKGDYGFDKLAFDVKKVDIDIDQNYNDDFKNVSNYIIDNLNNKDKTGLYILDGASGNGKSFMIRYMAGKIDRNIIFISPDMVDYITDPSFIPFLMNNNDSVLIIEDAEPALQKRDGTSRTSAISNILNLTDGLLSDCLNISIVTTFNTDINTIDDALLRKGRLIKRYTFDKLAKDKSSKLLKKLGHNVDAIEPMSLSEIYNYGTDNGTTNEQKKIGFKKS